MKAEAIHPVTGDSICVNVSDDRLDEIESLQRERISDHRLYSYIDQLNISADAKALIETIVRSTIRVGKAVIRIGKRIIEVVLSILSKFPNVTFGLVLGLVVYALVASIPILGALFGGLLGPIAVLFGLVNGYFEDIKDKQLERKIMEASAHFSALRGANP
jgi:hypothetical protein